MSAWFCPSLIIPHGVATILHEWVRKQDWPEGTKIKAPETYHVTLAYSSEGYVDSHLRELVRRSRTDHRFLVWPQRADVFEPGDTDFRDDGAWQPVVLELGGPDAPALKRYAEKMIDGVERAGYSPSRFEGGYTPHITIAVMPPGKEAPDQWMPRIPDFPFVLEARPVELHALYDDRKAR